jgi:hypothetical protein
LVPGGGGDSSRTYCGPVAGGHVADGKAVEDSVFEQEITVESKRFKA